MSIEGGIDRNVAQTVNCSWIVVVWCNPVLLGAGIVGVGQIVQIGLNRRNAYLRDSITPRPKQHSHSQQIHELFR